MSDHKVFVYKATNGKSYIKNANSPISYLSNVRINGEVPTRSPGSDSFYVSDVDVTSVQTAVYHPRKMVGFVRKAEFAALPRDTYPLQMPFDAFPQNEDARQGGHGALYEPMYEEVPPTYQDIPFEVLVASHEPIDMPSWAQPDFPYGLEFAPWFWHAYPCSISPANLWNHAASAVRKVVAAYPNRYEMTDYDNIQSMTVNLKISVPFLNMTKVVARHDRKGNPVFESRAEQFRRVPILNMVGTYKSDNENTVRLPTLRGKNFMELHRIVDDYCTALAKSVDVGSWSVCEHCKGTGIIKA